MARVVVDGYEGGGAMVTRMHHCIADGIALARVMLSLTDPAARRPPSSCSTATASAGCSSAPPARSLRRSARAARSRRPRARGRRDAARPRPRRPAPRRGGRGVRALAKALGTPADQGALCGELHAGERVAWCRPVSLADVKRIARAHDATVNDVLVSAVTGGLQRWMLARRPSPVDGVPRAARARDPRDGPVQPAPARSAAAARSATASGSCCSRCRCSSPTRSRGCTRSTAACKRSRTRPRGSSLWGARCDRASPRRRRGAADRPLLVEGFARAHERPRADSAVYLVGTQLRGVLVWAPCAGSVSTSVSIFFYDGQVSVGFMCDAGPAGPGGDRRGGRRGYRGAAAGDQNQRPRGFPRLAAGIRG